MPALVFSFQNERSEGTITASFEPGTYRCTVAATSNVSQIVDAFGHTPVKSEIVEFTVE
jgi:pterin-4a-carbinolamine dehydratase